MAESKFDKIFQNTPPAPLKPALPAESKSQARRRMESPTAPAGRPLGRPPGKRSDPAWKQFSVLLKKDTQRAAAAVLKAKDEGLDLSELVQSLLESWLKRQKS